MSDATHQATPFPDWREMLPGVMTSVLAGDPDEPGSAFVLLYRTAVPVDVQTQSNRRDKHLTVLGGVVKLGFGESAEQAIETLGPGSYAVIPGGVRHRIHYGEGSLVQVHGIGPYEALTA